MNVAGPFPNLGMTMMASIADWSEVWADLALRVSALMSVAALVASLVLWKLRGRVSAEIRFLVWWFVLACGACWFYLPFGVPTGWARVPSFAPLAQQASLVDSQQGMNQPAPSAEESVSGPATPQEIHAGDAELSQSDATTPVGETNVSGASAVADAKDSPPSSEFRSMTVSSYLALFLLWVCGVGGMGIVLLVQCWWFQRRLKGGVVPSPSQLQKRFAGLIAELNVEPESTCRPSLVRRATTSLRRIPQVRLRVSRGCPSPLVTGILRPTIWLPVWVTDLSARTQQVVLAHEFAHIARRDLWATLLATVSWLLNAHNPLSWWLRRRLAVEREAAADRWVLRRANFSATVYAGALVDVAERVPVQMRVSATAMVQRRSELYHRVEGVVSGESLQTGGRRLLVLIVASIFLLGSVVLGTPAVSESTESKTAAAGGLFPQEIEAYPDLAHVDMILNRQPFQHFTKLGSAKWLDEGRTLLTADRAGFYVWDVKSRELQRRLPATGTNTNRVEVSPDGTKLALMPGKKRELRILSWPSLEVIQTIPGVGRVPEASAFSHDGKYLALSFEKSENHSSLSIYDCEMGKLTVRRNGPSMDGLAWAPDDSFIAVGESRGIIIFLTPDGELIRRGIRLEPSEAPRSLDISADGKLLAVCTNESIGVYQVQGRKKLWYHAPEEINKRRPKFNHLHLAFNNSGTEVIIRRFRRRGDRGSALLAYDARSGRQLRERKLGRGWSEVLEISADGRRIATGGVNQSVAIYDAATFEPVVAGNSGWKRDQIHGGDNYPVAVRPSPNGKQLLAVGSTNIALWDLQTGKRVWSVDRPDWVRDAAWEPGGKWIATVRDGNARRELKSAAVEIIDPANGTTTKTLPLDDPRGGPVLVLSGNRIAACGKHHTYLFDESGTRLWKTRLCEGHTELLDLAVDPQESLLAVVTRVDGGQHLPHSQHSQGSISVRFADDGDKVYELLCPTTPERIMFSADGKYVVAATNNSPRRRGAVHPLLERWSIETGKRENIAAIPDENAEDLIEWSEFRSERVRDLLQAWPLLTSNIAIVNGFASISPDRKQMLLQKPLVDTLPSDTGHPRWAGRLMLWDAEAQKSLGQWVLPDYQLWDTAFLPDGRIVTLNANGTIFVMRRPE